MDRGRSTTGSKSGSSLLYRFGGAVIRHVRVVLILWLLATAVLAVKGFGLEGRLSAPEIGADGVASHDQQLADRSFGEEDDLVLMLRGPTRVLDREGRRVERALDALPGIVALSPWNSGGSIAKLRPDPRTAVLIVNVDRTSDQDSTDVLPPVRTTIDRMVRPPLRADLSGSPVIAAAMANAISDTTEASMLIALPILFIVVLVLLLAFGSVLALVPVIVGVTTVAASRGLMDILSGSMGLTSLATEFATMVGLGLGVGYSLLVVFRFHEEMRSTGNLAEAVQTTVATTGRTVMLAGTGLLIAMFAAALVMPGTIFDSVAIAIAIASLAGVVAAIVVVPALLTLFEPLPESMSRRRRGALAEPAAAGWLRRPGLVAAMTVFLLLGGTAAAFALDTGPLSARSLPAGNSDRAHYEAVERKLGPGWGTPFEIVMDGGDRPVTEPKRLKALADFQRAVESDPGVAMMVGLSGLERGIRQLSRFPHQLDELRHGMTVGQRSLTRARDGVGLARLNANQISSGFADAAAGAESLRSVTGRTQAGAAQLARELHASEPTSERLLDRLKWASEAGGRLAQSAARTGAGVQPLTEGLKEARKSARSMPKHASELRGPLNGGVRELQDASERVDSVAAQLAAAWSDLRRMTVAKADPQYQTAIQAVEQASIVLTGIDPSTGEPPEGGEQGIGDGVQDAAGQVNLGLFIAARAKRSGKQAQRGIKRLQRGASQLSAGLGKVASDSDRVATGFERSNSQLSAGLGEVASDSDGLDAVAFDSDGLGGVAFGGDLLATGFERSNGSQGGASQGGNNAQLVSGGANLADGFERLQDGGGNLASGLVRLSKGADALAAGLGTARSGTDRLANGLAKGASNSGALVSGLAQMVRGLRGQGAAFAQKGALDRLRRRTPGLLSSGYLTLGSIDRANPLNRSQAAMLVNIDRGGHAARMLVVPKTGLLSDATQRTRERLTERADELGRRTDSEVVVAGQAAALQHSEDAVGDRIPILMLLLSAITVLVLVPSIRSLALALAAAALNALTVGATLGVLALTANQSFFGGPGYIETVGLAVTIAVVFGLSIGYQLVVLGRMRQERERTGSTELAIANGLRYAGAPLAAWAAIMIAIFAAFATQSFASVRSFGVGLAVATFIAAFLVCLLGLPAVMKLLGDRSWWLPGWLERILPRPRRAVGHQVAA